MHHSCWYEEGQTERFPSAKKRKLLIILIAQAHFATEREETALAKGRQ